jgi:hypothetical protein
MIVAFRDGGFVLEEAWRKGAGPVLGWIRLSASEKWRSIGWGCLGGTDIRGERAGRLGSACVIR